MVESITPLQVAKLVRRLDSRLTSIAGEVKEDKFTLTYTFTVAGSAHVFAIGVKDKTVASIADLYPRAAAFEQELSQQWGLVFQRPDAQCLRNQHLRNE
jgi:hypothetical protein